MSLKKVIDGKIAKGEVTRSLIISKTHCFNVRIVASLSIYFFLSYFFIFLSFLIIEDGVKHLVGEIVAALSKKKWANSWSPLVFLVYHNQYYKVLLFLVDLCHTIIINNTTSFIFYSINIPVFTHRAKVPFNALISIFCLQCRKCTYKRRGGLASMGL